MRIAGDDRSGRRLDYISNVCVGELAAEAADGGCREDDVADFAQPDEKDFQGSTVASSTSITGMSSLIG